MLETLREFGLSDKEARVYAAAVKLGTSTTYSLSIETGIKRSTVYDVLQSLTEKGLISNFIKQKKRHYEAADPESLLYKLKEKQTRVQSAIKELNKLKEKTSTKPYVELYLGKDGIKAVFELALKVRQPVYFYGKLDFFQTLKYAFPSIVAERIRLKIPVNAILQKNELTLNLKKTGEKEYRYVRFSKIKFDTTTLIFGNYIAHINTGEDNFFAVVISNKILAENQKKVFGILWNCCLKNK